MCNQKWRNIRPIGAFSPEVTSSNVTRRVVKAFLKDMQRPCDGQFKMTEETILRAVMEDWMFDALEVDLELPDHLKGKVAEMPPVFKNTHVSREDIGDHRYAYRQIVEPSLQTKCFRNF